MKKILILFVITIAASVSSFAYTVTYSAYNNGTKQQQYHYFYINSSTINVQIFASRGPVKSTGDIESSYGSVNAIYEGEYTNIFSYMASAQKFPSTASLNRTFRFTPKGIYRLDITLYCPLKRDYARVKVSW